MDRVHIDAIADPRWVLEAYAPELYILIKTAPHLGGLADLSESVLTGLQEGVRDRYQELVAMEGRRAHWDTGR